MLNGASAFLLKERIDAQFLVEALTFIVDYGGFLLDPVIANAAGAAFGGARISLANAESRKLSGRERDVLRLLEGGARDKEIALELGIKPNTVHNQVASLLSKLGAATRFEAGLIAGRERL